MQNRMGWNFLIAGVFIFIVASSSFTLASPEYLKENSVRDGVVVLPSGLQYEIMVEGKGAKPGPKGYSDYSLPWHAYRWLGVR